MWLVKAMPSAISAILFDLDGTLIDSAVSIAAALSSMRLARGGDAIDPAAVRPLVSQGAATLVREALGPLAVSPEADLDEFRAMLRTHPPDPGIIYPGVPAALTEFQKLGTSLAIVTNKPEALARWTLEELDLARFFSAIVGGDSADEAKPSPKPIMRALEGINARPDHSALVGDSPIDAQAAAAARLRFVLFEGGYDAAGCSGAAVAARFAHFGELKALTERLAAHETVGSN